jgi:peroxiredoxin
MPRSFVFVLVLLVLSLGLNVRLGWKVKELTPVPQPDKAIGVQVAGFTASDLEGKTTDISFNTGKPTVIYYMNPMCMWCKANAASFNTLAHALSERARILVLSRSADNIDRFLADTPQSGNKVLIVNSQKLIDDLGLTATPQTFVINSAGRVEHHWVGAYDRQNRTEIEKFFSVRLPDIKPPA